MSKGRLVIGVTGTFGSGKSTVSRLFKKCGAKKIIDCDRIAHEPFRAGHPLRPKLKALFRGAVVADGGKLNRSAVAREVFRDRRKLKRLEAILHPYVYRRVRSEAQRVREGVVVVEVPLLFETGFYRLCNVTVAVLAGERNILKRLGALGFSKAEILARQRVQFSEARKKRLADFIIKNTGSKQFLEKRIKSLCSKLHLKGDKTKHG